MTSSLPPWPWTTKLPTPPPATPNVRARPLTVTDAIGAPLSDSDTRPRTTVSALAVPVTVTTPALYTMTAPPKAGDRLATVAESSPVPEVTVSVVVGRANE